MASPAAHLFAKNEVNQAASTGTTALTLTPSIKDQPPSTISLPTTTVDSSPSLLSSSSMKPLNSLTVEEVASLFSSLHLPDETISLVRNDHIDGEGVSATETLEELEDMLKKTLSRVRARVLLAKITLYRQEGVPLDALSASSLSLSLLSVKKSSNTTSNSIEKGFDDALSRLSSLLTTAAADDAVSATVSHVGGKKKEEEQGRGVNNVKVTRKPVMKDFCCCLLSSFSLTLSSIFFFHLQQSMLEAPSSNARGQPHKAATAALTVRINYYCYHDTQP